MDQPQLPTEELSRNRPAIASAERHRCKPLFDSQAQLVNMLIINILTTCADLEMNQFNTSLPMMLYRALDVVMPRFRKIFREFGLTEQQWRVLRVLWECRELSSSELANLTLIPKPSLVGVVNRLESRNLVARRRYDSDRRGVLVRVTPDGRKLKAQVTPRIDAVYRDMRLSVHPDTWEQIQYSLDCLCRIDEVDGSRVSAAKNRETTND